MAKHVSSGRPTVVRLPSGSETDGGRRRDEIAVFGALCILGERRCVSRHTIGFSGENASNGSVAVRDTILWMSRGCGVDFNRDS